MINLIFWSLVCILISSIINKPNPNNLYCGLFGYCSASPPDIDKLKILGILNEERGKHSAGMYVGDEIIKNVGTFTTLIRTNDIYKEVYNMATGEAYNVDYTVIGHTRQPSTGMGGTKHEAHPFGIANAKDPYGDYRLVGAHNGTISNWKALCKEFNVDTKDIEVDSLGLLSILADKNFDVFNQYEGGAAVLWTYPDAKNTLFVFKGATKSFATSVNFIEDRPLYYWKTKKDGLDAIYISSLKESLFCIGGEVNNVFSFENNVIYAINAGVITKLKFVVHRKNVDSSSKNNTYYSQLDFYEESYGYNKPVNKNKNVIPLNQKAATSLPTLPTTNPLYSQIPFYNKSTNYKDGIIKMHDVTVEDIIKETTNLLGGRIYYGKDCKMHRNGHILGSLNARSKIKLDKLKKDGNYSAYQELLLTLSVKYTTDRLGFVKDSIYTLYKTEDQFTEYMYIDGYMLDPTNDDAINDFVDYYYYGKNDIGLLASYVIQPLIVNSVTSTAYHKDIVVYFNLNELVPASGLHSAFYSIVPFTNGLMSFLLYGSSFKGLNRCVTFGVHVDYSYNSVVFEIGTNSSIVTELAYFPNVDDLEVVDTYTVKDGSISHMSPKKTIDKEIDDLPFTVDDDRCSNYASKLKEDLDEFLNKEKLEESLKTNAEDLELLQEHYDLCNDVSDNLVDFLRVLQNEENLNTVEATECFNLFTADVKDIVDLYEDSRNRFIENIIELDTKHKENVEMLSIKVIN